MKPNIAQKAPIIEDVSPSTVWWCACGLSKNQPYCDGSHKETEFVPTKVEIPESKKVAWCACKHSSNAPYCDGSHKNL
jgi:CDGSH-type Zn-finger protein